MSNNPAYYSDDKGTLNATGETQVALGLSILKYAVAQNNFEKGWRDPNGEPRPMGEVIALLHSEVTEAFEAHRNNEPIIAYDYGIAGIREESSLPEEFVVVGDYEPGKKVLGKPIGIASELADVIIRVLDMADERNIPVIQALIEKHAYNQSRPYRHGNKVC